MNKPRNIKRLVIGYGNPGRQDDGLGAAFVKRLESQNIPGIDCFDCYQLNVEDALTCASYDEIIFVDAHLDLKPPYRLHEISPSDEALLGSHSLNPEGVLSLCASLYQKRPKAWILAIKGCAFDVFEEKLSTQACGNLELAMQAFAHKFLTKGAARA